MDSLFDPSATKVVLEYAANDVVLYALLRKREGFQWSDIDVQSDGYRRQVKEALSCGGTMDVCVDCAVVWSQRVVLGLAAMEGPVATIARLWREDGKALFHVLGGSCAAGVKSSSA